MVRDYSKGFIYKLCCKDVNVKEIYVGSSINMKARKTNHKTDCNNINSRIYNSTVYKYIRENGGFDNWSMIHIKDYPCNSKRELEAEEDKIMRELNATLNTNKPIYDIQKRKEYIKKYKEENKEKIKIQKKKDDKKYYEKNKEEINKKKREKSSIKIICECGLTIRKDSMNKHLKRKLHLKLLSS